MALPHRERLSQPLTLGLLGLALALCAGRIVVSTGLPLFGDEAFYWLEGQHLAWAYSDLPPMTAWLTRLGTAVFGHSYLGVRSVFLLLGFAVPLLLAKLATLLGASPRGSLLAALVGVAIPVQGLQALFALPDIVLNVIWLATAITAAKLLRGENHLRIWIVLGVLVGLGFLTHYRFLPVAAGLALLVVVTDPGRLRQPGPWLAAAIAAAALWPQWSFNQAQDYAALSFQFADRHPWQFDPEGFRLAAIDLILLTPGVALVLIWAAWHALRAGRTGPGAVLIWMGVFPVAIYWLLSPFIDTERATFHWTHGGWLTLAAGVPLILRTGPPLRVSLRTLLALSLACGLVLPLALQYYWMKLSADINDRPPAASVMPDHFLGWPAVARRVVQHAPPGVPLVADNFMLAAELAFETGRRVYTLDHPLNHKHGRSRQLAIWQLDRVPKGKSVLVVEETATSLKYRPEWMRAICDEFGHGQIVDDINLHAGRKRALVWLMDQNGSGGCDLPAHWKLEQPRPGPIAGQTLVISGWAFENGLGVEKVSVLHNGIELIDAGYGKPRPDVMLYFADTISRDHPHVGFAVELDTSEWASGAHDISIRIYERDGAVRESSPRPVVIGVRQPG